MPPRTIKTWGEAKRLVLRRIDMFGNECKLDRGINYFILTLDKLGAPTLFSCEGHPGGCYVLFAAPLELVQRIQSCGFFRVELEGGVVEKNGKRLPRWSIRASFDSEKDKRRFLSWAAEAWNREFGDLHVEGDRIARKKRRKSTK